MATWVIVLLILLGGALLLFGKRLWLVGAGIGALLGVSLVGLFPSILTNWVGVLVIFGLAITLGVLAVLFKGFTSLIAFGIGFLAGGTIILGILDLLGVNAGFVNFLFAIIFGLVGAFLARRFYQVIIVVFAGLTGAVLVVRGVELLLGGAGLNDALSSLLVLALAGGSVWNQLRSEK